MGFRLRPEDEFIEINGTKVYKSAFKDNPEDYEILKSAQVSGENQTQSQWSQKQKEEEAAAFRDMSMVERRKFLDEQKKRESEAAPIALQTKVPVINNTTISNDNVSQDEITEVEEEPKIDLPKAKAVAANEPVQALRTEPIAAPITPEAARPVEKQPDETDQLMSEYRKKRGEVESEQAALEEEMQAGERSRQMQTGIAGALQSFGEGLAAITGGSAKPIQTGAATLKSIGEQQAAAQERKGKTLKERLQMAKAPIEEKEAELSLRSRLTKSKMEQGLLDPNSEQSVQARKDAAAFIDNMITQGTANKAAPEVLQRLEQSKALIGQMSAAQVQQFYDTLKPLSTDTSLEAKNKFDMQKMAAQENLRLRLAEAKDSKDQQKVAQKEFIKDQSAIAKQVAETAAVSQELKSFRNDLKLALAGDKEAAKRVTQKSGVVNYLNARSIESKGVFTDNDLRALSELQATRWFDQFNDWVSKGFEGVLPKQSLIRVQDILDRNAYKFDDPSKYVYDSLIEKYKGLDEVSETGVWKPYLSNLQKKAGSVKSKVEQPQTEVVKKVKPGDIDDGYRFKGGDPSNAANWEKVQ